jgi:uncharacterized protein
MLKFRVRDIPPEGVQREMSLEPIWFVANMGGIEGGWDRATGLLKINLSRQGSEVLARGALQVHFAVSCARCLGSAAVRCETDFATTFVPAGAPDKKADAPQREPEPEDDEPDIQRYSGEEIDLDGFVREQIILGLPISVLCRPDCKGLCAQCGQELNVHPCECVTPPDPRWDALRRLRQD